MTPEEIEQRLLDLAAKLADAAVQRDFLIAALKGSRSSRDVARVCGRSHAYVCKIWRELGNE
jgi:hypothetical protein